jgi:hypothetical protein
MRTEQLSVQPPSQVGSMVSQKIIPDNSSRVNFESIQKLAVLAGVQVHKSSNMKEFLEKISQTKK